MSIVSIFGDEYAKAAIIRYTSRAGYVINTSIHERIETYPGRSISPMVHLARRVQIVHSSYPLRNKLHMNTDTITRLMNLGIVEEDGGVLTLTGKYIKYIDEVCYRLLSNEYKDAYVDDPYSLMLDSNAYAITSWVGIIRESELVEMLNAVMSIWGEMLLW